MAKTKRTSTNTPTDTNTNLANTLKINGTTYNITATTADTAEKVQAALTITKKKVNEDDDESITFNGKDPAGVSVVPAEGGKFTGQILVPYLDQDETKNYADQVINRTDTTNLINGIVENLTGLPSYIWKDGELTPELEPENQTDYKALKIISAEDNDTYEEFKDSSKSNVAPYIFIYKNTGDIWLKSVDSDSVNITEKIKNSLIGGTPAEGVNQPTLWSLYNELIALSNSLATNKTELNALITAIDNRVTELLGESSDSSDRATIHGTRNFAKELSEDLNDAIIEITNGTTKVGKSTYSEQSGQSDTIKVQTADGKTEYYSTIYFGSSAPASSLGKDGDIYIRIP